MVRAGRHQPPGLDGEKKTASTWTRLLRRGFEFLCLPLKLFGEFHELSSRRIVPRQALRQPQTGFGFIPEIGRVHRASPCLHGHWVASDCIERKRKHASRRDEDHRLSRCHCHKLGSADAAAISRLSVEMPRIGKRD